MSTYKVLSVSPIVGEIVDFGLNHEFIRYGKDSWYESFGTADEPVGFPEELESAYQSFKGKDNI